MRIGIDLGGSKIEIIALNNTGVECYRQRIPTPQGNYEKTLDSICGLVDAAEQNLRAWATTNATTTATTKATIGIGIPGAISMRLPNWP